MDRKEGNWRKASYSNGSGDCVEVADASHVVLVRDTKNRDGATLTVPADAWRRLTREIKGSLAVQQPNGDPDQRTPTRWLGSSAFSALHVIHVLTRQRGHRATMAVRPVPETAVKAV